MKEIRGKKHDFEKLSSLQTSGTGTVPYQKQQRQQYLESAQEEAVQTVTELALQIYAVYPNAENQNIVYSPIALATSLSMASIGMSPSAQDELRPLINLPPQPEERILTQESDSKDTITTSSFDGISQLIDTIQESNGNVRSQKRKGVVEFRQKNAIWIQEKTRFSQNFLDSLATYFDEPIHAVDFRSEPNVAQESINNWVEQETNQHFQQVFTRGEISQYTRFAITSVATIQAPWELPMHQSSTGYMSFTQVNGEQKDVPNLIVQSEDTLRIAQINGWIAIAFPYLGNKTDFVVILPPENTFNMLSTQPSDVSGNEPNIQLTMNLYMQLIDTLEPLPVNVTLPRFAFTQSTPLIEIAKSLSAEHIFRRGSTPPNTPFASITQDEPLAIDRFVHQSFISIDEDGSDAKATTVISNDKPIRVENIVINRPFLFTVIDRQTTTPLLFGHVVDPHG